VKLVKLSVLMFLLSLGVAYTSTSLTGWSPISAELVEVPQTPVNATASCPEWVPSFLCVLTTVGESIGSSIITFLGTMLSAVFLTGFFLGALIPLPVYAQVLITVSVNTLYAYSLFQLYTGRAGKVYD